MLEIKRRGIFMGNKIEQIVRVLIVFARICINNAKW